MSFEGFKGIPIERIGGLVSEFASEKIPPGVSPYLKNCRFGLNSVATRYGLQPAMSTGLKGSIRGLASLVKSSPTIQQFPVIYDSLGNFFYETPVGSGTLVKVTPTQVPLIAGAYMQSDTYFQREYICFTDMLVGVGTPGVFNGANLDPYTQRPFGEPWQASTAYYIGQVITPSSANGHTYRAGTSGSSGATEPTWPTTDGGTVVDSGVTWQELTVAGGNVLSAPPQPTLTRVSNGGTFAAGRDVYIEITFVNGMGESVVSATQVLVNTAVNDAVQVTSPAMPQWLALLIAPYKITGYNVYEADVATAASAPAATAYRKSGGLVAIGTNATVTAAAGGALAPTASTAFIVPTGGNVCSGVRYGAVLFVNRNNNISGFDFAGVFSITSNFDGLKLWMGNIPVGPDNTIQRIIILGTAGLSSQGPFFYVPKNSTVSAVAQTSFVLNDNTTTATTLNFLDDYLQTTTQMTDNSRKIKIPPQATIEYLPSLRRFVTIGESGNASLARLSEPDDPEGFYGDTGFMYVARDDGQKLFKMTEWNKEVFAFKERGGFSVRPNDGDPSTWPADKIFGKVGPCGFRASDAGAQFVAFAHRSNPYLFQGAQPIPVGDEILDEWRKINWAYGHLISVCVDDEEMEVHYCVPYGGSTQPNKRFTLNFRRGIEPPVHFSSFAGKEVANPAGRKWSIDDVPANQMKRVERVIPQPNANSPVDSTMLQTQMLVASPFNDGVVAMVQPGTYNDFGQGIDWDYDFASVGGSAVMQFGGFALSCDGNGLISAYQIPYHGEAKKLRDLKLVPQENKYYRVQGRGQSRQWGIRFTNRKEPDVWCEIFSASIYVRPMWTSEFSAGAKV